MAINPSGYFLFEDEYGVKYEAHWETIKDVIDITCVTMQPYVWGREPAGEVKGRTLYREGVITVHRQVLKQEDDSYIIVAEGASQVVGMVQMSYPCEPGPSDPFKYHLNCAICEEQPYGLAEGPRWADPDDPGDDSMIWGDVEADGSPSESGTGTDVTGGVEHLEWIDVWS